ncbi:hypothetical protein [Hyphomicrobium sp. DMF-1]|uniref:hypothetical protein n=1 Tax=Hyphomicrobium sp. DMF-1 TaxID=3019544 RepID=UPI0022EBE1AF|nr:hypothetical protein [Hyphomicrobium sp. DMF-1]WBT38058.1 hypothetical protein PE058_20760 [Hyphomicrobium sp. DMF-1]
MNTNVNNTNNSVKAKAITVTLEDGSQRAILVSGIRYLQIVNGPKGGDVDGSSGGFQSKIYEAGKIDPTYARESVKELRSNDFQLVYVGGGKYAVRGNIMRLEPITPEQKKIFAEQANASDTSKFRTRVVLTRELGSFWATKTIAELNERGVRFVGIGDGAAVHTMNIRKLSELKDDDRQRISAKYNIDGGGFRTQVTLQGEDRPKVSRLSLVEFRSQGLDLVDIGEGDTVVRENIKFFGPFTEEDKARAANSGINADRFVTKFTLANGNGTVLSTTGVDELKTALKAVNIGYDRFVPAANIAQDRVAAFTKDEKSSLSQAGYDVQRAWKSSVALINGMALSPATPEQIKQRCEKALGTSGGATTAPEEPPELGMA